jgi:hypothetical protein
MNLGKMKKHRYCTLTRTLQTQVSIKGVCQENLTKACQETLTKTLFTAETTQILRDKIEQKRGTAAYSRLSNSSMHNHVLACSS